MIRDDVASKITYKLCKDWAIRSHISTLCERLYVYPDGSLSESQEPSDNTWQVLRSTNTTVEYLIKMYNSSGCNCDACAQYDEAEYIILHQDDYNDNAIIDAKAELSWDTGNYLSKYEWYDLWIGDTDEISNITDSMTEALDNIPYGYFDDEK